ncbi:VanZ family protein [Actinomadura rudentiformis]|uniref:VanZ family protein n=1 Tax=Actinomadura rudentiformis TaxID=359158 RepID=A0A6H9YF30_9ACTN|nr:VanZ family protein [Actinomadura rudentiformis]KAB2342374.1 VanZ family protein [Actinomadura rudentiformis]
MPHHVPVEALRALSLWALLAAVLLVLIWRPFARRAGWAPVPTLALLLWTGLVLSMTLPMSIGPDTGARAAQCLSDPAGDMAWSVRIFGTRGIEDVMNVALWVPCGFLAVLATRRVVVAPAIMAGAFVVVEFLQVLDPGRECDPGDWAYNSFGTAVGAAAAVAVRHLADSSHGSSRGSGRGPAGLT